MKPRAAALLIVVGLLPACVYYNALYNAQHLLDQAEHARLAGQDSLAAARYRDVVRKAASGFRQEPTGPWAAEALLLLGRARLRLGELAAAEAALSRAEALADTPAERMEARMYRGIALMDRGEVVQGTSLVSGALASLPRGPAAAEGHLRRGEALLAGGTVDTGWWDLEQASQMDRGLRTAAAIARERWAIHYDDTLRARTSFDSLLAYREAGGREDTIAALAKAAGARWGSRTGLRMLGALDSATWAGTPRGRLRVVRAGLLRDAGDTTAAESMARHVADGVGPAAVEARLTLARWQLAEARDPAAVHEVTLLLASSGGDERLKSLLQDLKEFDSLAEATTQEPLAFFAAAEVARDRLGAKVLARALFLAYADWAPNEPWAPKSLLAALSLTRDEGDRAWLRGRLERYATSPYVLAARGAPAPGLGDLEEELSRRLQEIVKR